MGTQEQFDLQVSVAKLMRVNRVLVIEPRTVDFGWVETEVNTSLRITDNYNLLEMI